MTSKDILEALFENTISMNEAKLLYHEGAVSDEDRDFIDDDDGYICDDCGAMGYIEEDLEDEHCPSCGSENLTYVNTYKD